MITSIMRLVIYIFVQWWWPAGSRGESPHSWYKSKVGSQSKPPSQCSPFAAHLTTIFFNVDFFYQFQHPITMILGFTGIFSNGRLWFPNPTYFFGYIFFDNLILMLIFFSTMNTAIRNYVSSETHYTSIISIPQFIHLYARFMLGNLQKIDWPSSSPSTSKVMEWS